LQIILTDRKYNISIRERIENPVNNPRTPPKFAKKSIGPYSSFLSEEIKLSDLKNRVKEDRCDLKHAKCRPGI
jgi:hypothetical protein